MGATEVLFIREVFSLSQRELARALNVAPYTVARWETEGPKGNAPTGLQAEVLRGLHGVAVEIQQRNDHAEAKVVGGLVALGIGALIFYLLTRK